MRRRAIGALLAAASVSLLLAACGSSSPKNHGVQTAARSVDVKFSACMRTHGLANFPDVIPNQGLPIQHELNGSVAILVNGVPQPVSSPKLNAALNSCGRYMRNFFGSPVGSGTASSLQNALVQTAACMRRHGVPNYPDPPALGTVQRANMSAKGRAFSAGINVDTPAFKAALAKCGSIIANALNGQ